MKSDRNKLVNIIDIAIAVSLLIHVIGAQIFIALSSIALGSMIILIISRLILNADVYKPERVLFIVFLLFVLAELISSIFSIAPGNSFENSRRVLLFTSFFAAIIFIKDLKQLRYILLSIFIFTALLSVYEISKFTYEYLAFPENRVFSETRLQYFGYPITTGEIKMLILLLLIPFFFLKEDFVTKKLWLAVMFIPVFISFFLTNARSAMLGLFIGVIIIGALKNWKFLIAFIVLIILFLLFAPQTITTRILSITDFNHPTIQSRFVMWETGLKIIKDYFFFGIGDTDLMRIYKDYKIPQYSGEGVHLHNNFLQVFLLFGVFGFIVWLVMIGYILFRQIRIFLLTRRNNLLNILSVSSISCMAAFLVSGLTEWNFGDFEFAAVLWFTLGLAFLAEKFYIKEQHG